MGRDLYEKGPRFRSLFDEAAGCVPGLLDVTFNGPAERLAQTHIAQVALLTVETALATCLLDHGIRPIACAGHSLGEFSALVAAEALSFSEALRLVALRGRLMSQDVPEGGMTAVIGLAPDAIEADLPDTVNVANFNGPLQTIVSGPLQGLEQAEENLREAGAKRVLRLPVSGPFHSPLMGVAAESFRTALESAAINPPCCRFVSSVTGRECADPETIRAALADQICSPVRWTGVMQDLGPVAALEIGPGRVLQGLAKRTDGAPRVTAIGTWESANLVCTST